MTNCLLILLDIFMFDNDTRKGRSADKNFGIIKYKCRTEHGKSFYNNRVLGIWETIPDNIKSIQAPVGATVKSNVFRNRLHSHYRLKLNNVFNIDSVCTWVSNCQCNMWRI